MSNMPQVCVVYFQFFRAPLLGNRKGFRAIDSRLKLSQRNFFGRRGCSDIEQLRKRQFLANVNSRSCSLRSSASEVTTIWRYTNVYIIIIIIIICCGLSVSVVCLSVTFVLSTQPVEIFGNFSMPFGTLAIHWHSWKVLRRSSQANPSVGGWGLNARCVAKYSDFWHFEGYIPQTVQNSRYVSINHWEEVV